MEFHERRFPTSVNQTEGMHTESFHKAKRTRYRTIGHDPHRHMNALWRERNEIPKIVMGGLCLRESAVRFRFGGMDEVGKLNCVLNKKDGHIIAHDVPVAFLRVQLYCEAAHIAGKISRAFVAGYRREAYERRDLLTRTLEQV